MADPKPGWIPRLFAEGTFCKSISAAPPTSSNYSSGSSKNLTRRRTRPFRLAQISFLPRLFRRVITLPASDTAGVAIEAQ